MNAVFVLKQINSNLACCDDSVHRITLFTNDYLFSEQILGDIMLMSHNKPLKKS